MKKTGPRAARPKALPVTLTIAGSDNSSGAGIQADLKTFSALGCYGLTTVTCVVAEVPGKVEAIQAIRADVVARQIRLSFEAFPVAAIKTGMLYSTAITEAVSETLAECLAASGRRRPPLVIDPVMVASSGDALLKPAAIAAYRKRLFPLATLITPNLDELRVLSGLPCRSLAEMKEAGRALVDQYRCAFLLKGGHLRGKTAVDILAEPGGGFTEFSAPFVRLVSTHGTGCTYSAAITAGLAQGQDLPKAVGQAKMFINAALRDSLRWGGTFALQNLWK